MSASSAQATGTMGLLTRLSRQAYRRIGEEQLGMRLKSFGTLTTLRELGDMPQSQLGAEMCIDANNLVLILNDLESEGLAERRRDPADRRRHIVAMTEKGRERLDEADRQLESVDEAVLAKLTAAERGQLHKLLKRALDG